MNKFHPVLICIVLILAAQTRAANTTPQPTFSWDKVPLYIHLGKNDGFTDNEINFIATHSNFVCLEKGHGVNKHQSTEAGIEHDAARLKAINPNLRLIYYWNTFLDYHMYDAHNVYNNHPEWFLKKSDGSLDFKKGTLKRYDLSNPQVRQWWVNEVDKAVNQGSCDGVFMDAFPQITNPANIKLWGQEKFDAVQKGLLQTIKLTRQTVGPNNLLIFNGIRNTPNLHFGMDFINITDGATIEHFDQFNSTDKDNLTRDIQNMITAGKLGKIILFKGWPGFNWTQPELKSQSFDQLLAKARKNITFPLACYLIAAQPNSYFCYSWGYREKNGSLSDYPELQKPLGPPNGQATRNGYIYTRSFKHVDVWVNLETKQAKLNWK